MKEYHYIVEADSIGSLIERQKEILPEGQTAVFIRYFLSDPVRQKQQIPFQTGAVSYIGQPVLGNNSVAVWIYAVSGAEVELKDGEGIVRDGGVEHIWNASLVATGSGSEPQTAGILENYQSGLQDRGLSFADNCVRTWFYVRDIDNNYAGLVKGRRENFERVGLTPETHYIASTGIAGSPACSEALVQMDAWSVRGLENCHQRYIYAPTHLNPTYEYGVTFERGVRLDYSGRAHVVISGTASIDNRGNVLHVGDVAAQTGRMLENVDVLLAEGGAGFKDVKVMLVYIRNVSDHAIVERIFSERFADIPYVILHAPVCRPDWLIEMECIAEVEL